MRPHDAEKTRISVKHSISLFCLMIKIKLCFTSDVSTKILYGRTVRRAAPACTHSLSGPNRPVHILSAGRTGLYTFSQRVAPACTHSLSGPHRPVHTLSGPHRPVHILSAGRTGLYTLSAGRTGLYTFSQRAAPACTHSQRAAH